jgi:hypothetical protein
MFCYSAVSPRRACYMNDDRPNGEDDDSERQHSDDELQERAKHVWLKVKIFGVLVGVFALFAISFFTVAAYRSFGGIGVVIVTVILIAVLWLLSRVLLFF